MLKAMIHICSLFVAFHKQFFVHMCSKLEVKPNFVLPVIEHVVLEVVENVVKALCFNLIKISFNIKLYNHVR